jgi:hypothetical protein
LAYISQLALYEKVVDTAMVISVNQHGIDTDGRGVRASRIYTRQTLTAISLRTILPHPSAVKPHDSSLWDIGSIASLARNLVEGYLGLHYFGLEGVTESEAELRFFLLQLHRNVELYEIRRVTNSEDPSLREFEEGIHTQKKMVKDHPFLASLTADQRNRALRGAEMYKTKMDFERELTVCKGLRRNYRYLSNLVHPLPLSIERVDFERGRGIGSEADVSHCTLCVVLARVYLAASTVGFADHFREALSSRFKKEIDAIRPLASGDYDAEADA